jgi:hypothetical protein
VNDTPRRALCGFVLLRERSSAPSLHPGAGGKSRRVGSTARRGASQARGKRQHSTVPGHPPDLFLGGYGGRGISPTRVSSRTGKLFPVALAR